MQKSRIALAILTTLSAPPLLAQALSSAYPSPPRSRHVASGATVAQQAKTASSDTGGAGLAPEGASQTVLYNQRQAEYPDDVLSFDAGGATTGAATLTSFAADDFFITDPDGWSVDEVDIDGRFGLSAGGGMNVDFYTDARGLPGPTPRCHYVFIDYEAPGEVGTLRPFTIQLPRTCELPPGKIWLSVDGSGRFDVQGGYYWAAFPADPPLGNEAVWKNSSGGFNIGCHDWTPLHECEYTTTALGFELIGTGRPTSFDEIFVDSFDSAGGMFFQPVQDTGFEHTTGDGESNPYWSSHDGNPSAQAGGTVLYSNVNYTIPVYQGHWEIWFGGWDNGQAETQTVSQTFTLASGGPRYLHYWRFIQTPPDGNGILTISVDGTAMSTLDVGIQGADADFGEHVIDVSGYADTRPHTITFEYDNDGVGTDGRIFIDWVKISDTADTNAPAYTERNVTQIPGTSKRG